MKKKVMFFIGCLGGGGAEKVLLNTISLLSRDKYDITLVLFQNSGTYVKEIPNDISVKYLTHVEKPNEIKWFYRLFHHVPFRLLYRFYIKEKYDVEIAFLEGLSTHVIGCSPNKKSKKIAWVHIDMYTNRWADVDYKSEKQHSRIYHNFNSIVCVSKYCENQFTKRFGNSYPLQVFHNAIMEKEIVNKSNDINEIVPDKKRFTLISSGRFTQQKGFDRLLKVHEKLLKKGFEFDLWLLGDGLMWEELKLYVNEHNLQEYVKLLGFKDNPYPYMSKADLFVCSSRSEGYSSVVCEALILGLPVISTNVSGADEILDYGKYGMIVDNDEESLYFGIKEIISDEQLLKKYKILAEERGKIFSSESSIKEVEKLLDEC